MAAENTSITSKFRSIKRPTVVQIVLWSVGLVLGITLFFVLRGFISCYRLTSLPGVPPPACSSQAPAPVTNAQGTPVASTATPTVSAPEVPLPPPWDGASRVNVLVMGLDYRDVLDIQAGLQQGAPRTDTMIVLTIDPLTKTAGAISIPRDLWVNIPGFGYHKINTAYTFGENNHLPGGGAGLAIQTVEAFLGVPINYYVWVEFSSFINAIDRVGGVDVCVPEKIDVARYDQEGHDILEPGCQTLSGIVALGYARARNTANGDIDRSGRQMQVIMGLRDKITSPENWAKLAAAAPGLYQDVSKGIHANMDLTDALKLAALAREIPKDSITLKVIDYTMMAPTKAPDGTDILRPFPDKIRVLRDDVFGTGALRPAAVGDPTQLVKDEAARVAVVNGTGTTGLAKNTADYLTAQGMNVTGYGNTTEYPDNYKSPFPNQTIIIVHAGKPYAMKYLSDLMKFTNDNQIVVNFDPNAKADIIIALGYDWTIP